MSQLQRKTLSEKRLSKNGYDFDIYENVWKISRSRTVKFFSLIEVVSEKFLENFRRVLAFYAENLSADHTTSTQQRFLHFCRFVAEAGVPLWQVTGTDLANYRSSLDSRREWYVGVLAGLLRRWVELGYDGLSDDVIPTLDGWRLKGNTKGEAVRLQSPTQGALTDLEYEGLYDHFMRSFEGGELSLEDASLIFLMAFSGRRSSQIADLQIQDFVVSESKDGFVQFVLNVPRRKQRDGAFRSSFRPFALNEQNGKIITQHIDSVKIRASNVKLCLGDAFPIFPDWKKVRDCRGLTEVELQNLPNDYFHRTNSAIRITTSKLVERARVVSERTGENIELTPIRWRRTVGTRAAREGYGPLLIAELLDHSDTQNASVYVENIPEHVNAINKAVASQLAPIAQAFAGKLISDESEAARSGDPSSRVRTGQGKTAGNCGHFGFCGALAPISCYTCSSFQPWVDGPHDEVLEHLLAENDRIGRATGDATISAINNRTIVAITQVIQMCDERKARLGIGHE